MFPFRSNPSEDGVLQALSVEPPSGVKNVSLQFIIKDKDFFDFEIRQSFSFDVNQFSFFFAQKSLGLNKFHDNGC